MGVKSFLKSQGSLTGFRVLKETRKTNRSRGTKRLICETFSLFILDRPNTDVVGGWDCRGRTVPGPTVPPLAPVSVPVLPASLLPTRVRKGRGRRGILFPTLWSSSSPKVSVLGVSRPRRLRWSRHQRRLRWNGNVGRGLRGGTVYGP